MAGSRREPSHDPTVTVAGRRLKLSHLDKVLYPSTGTTKADVIAYYSEIAPYLLPHVAGRPVTRKRWVDGVGTASKPGEVFFEKNLPSSAPSWLRRTTIEHKSHRNDYPLFDDEAALVWAAQVAALELHVPQWRVARNGRPSRPDRFVLDLDPGPGVGLPECVEVAKRARRLLRDLDMELFPVTSGSKGLHLYAPLDGKHTSEQVNDFAHELARTLESDLPDLAISTMRKADREGKVLVDWSQNNGAKTTVAPYSLRGTTEPQVAVPRTWRELNDPDLHQLTMDEVLARMKRRKDPLAGLDPVADPLSTYRSMRDASRTPEPVPDRAPSMPGDEGELSFVIQEHHATALHWDFRLEHDGVLVSWALPKGVPTSVGKNHLAVQTEDHPLEYGTFEGTIPKSEYGGGVVTIWDTGTFELEKWRDDEVIATLTGTKRGGLGTKPVRLALIRTSKGSDEKKNWLIHLMKDQVPAARKGPEVERASSRDVVEPMLARLGSADDVDDGGGAGSGGEKPGGGAGSGGEKPGGGAGSGGQKSGGGAEWAFEMKWDGIRSVAVVDGPRVRLTSRNGKDQTAAYPEVAEALAALGLPRTVLDGEIVAWHGAGGPRDHPDFGRLQQRMGLSKPREVAQARKDVPVSYVVFDVLRHDGTATTRRTYDERRALLTELDLDDGDVLRMPAAYDGDLAAAMRSSKELELEGVLAKRRSSTYRPGKRASSWIKIKHHRDAEVVIGGWRPGNGSRADGIGSLLLGVPDPDGSSRTPLHYVGRVGTGFSQKILADLAERLEPLARKTSPFVDVPRDVARDAHWVSPQLVGEVAFAEWTPSGHLRQPTWRGLRGDKEPGDVQAP